MTHHIEAPKQDETRSIEWFLSEYRPLLRKHQIEIIQHISLIHGGAVVTGGQIYNDRSFKHVSDNGVSLFEFEIVFGSPDCKGSLIVTF